MSDSLDNVADWAVFLRQVIDTDHVPTEVLDLEPNAMGNTIAGISLLPRYLAGRPAREQMLDGALRLVEAGDLKYVEPMMPLPLGEGRDGTGRIAAAIEKHRNALPDYLVNALLDRALETDPSNPAIVRVMEHEAQRPGRGPDVLYVVANYWPSWAASHIDWIPTSADSDGKLLLRVLGRTRTHELPVIIDAIGKAGPDYVDRLLRALAKWSADAQARVKPALAADPAFAGRVQ